ncbi:MAG: helix-turn-helix domain-containing protein [Candidatus Diapherotrites archaeon]|nr:helix-turn-helix domain-containing protein [Candidatus Diapherotrites archaeon]
MNLDYLETAGLSKNEAKVYHALLRSGATNSAELARQSGVHRINTYDVLNSLIAKGLVSFIVEGKQRLFKAENPKQLKQLLQDKLDSLETQLPELEQLFESKKQKVDVRVLSGNEGKKQQLGEQFRLGENGTLYLFLSHGLTTQLRAPYTTHLRKFYVSLKEKNALVKIILPDTKEVRQRAKFFQEFKDFVKIKYVKDLDIAGFSWQAAQEVFWLTILTEPILTIRVQSEQVAKIFKAQFELIWKKN